MLRFPAFLNHRRERRDEKEKEKELTMQGWSNKESATPHMGFEMQRNLPHGMGRHFARNAFKGRGIHQMIAHAGSRRGQSNVG